MSVILELALFPMDKGASVSPYVARVVEIIRKSGLPNVFSPMGTCIEGEWDAVRDVADACFKALQRDCDRVYMTVGVDYRRGRKNGLQGKVDSVERKLAGGGAA